jgi:hypothetical protein
LDVIALTANPSVRHGNDVVGHHRSFRLSACKARTREPEGTVFVRLVAVPSDPYSVAYGCAGLQGVVGAVEFAGMTVATASRVANQFGDGDGLRVVES